MSAPQEQFPISLTPVSLETAYSDVYEKGFQVVDCGAPIQFADSKLTTIKRLNDAASDFGNEINASHIGVKTLAGEGSPNMLDIHVESIIYPTERMLGYFALGCLSPSNEGGETVIYDARLAANTILQNYPDLADVQIRYTSTTYDGQEATHGLVENVEGYGNTLRFRSKFSTNEIVSQLPYDLNEDSFYKLMEEIVEDSKTAEHQWKSGELVIVNNAITLHSRLPYQGARLMQRYRYNDHHFSHIKLDAHSTEK